MHSLFVWLNSYVLYCYYVGTDFRELCLTDCCFCDRMTQKVKPSITEDPLLSVETGTATEKDCDKIEGPLPHVIWYANRGTHVT